MSVGENISTVLIESDDFSNFEERPEPNAISFDRSRGIIMVTGNLSRQVASHHDYSSGTVERDGVWFRALFKIAEIVALNEDSADILADAHLEVLAR